MQVTWSDTPPSLPQQLPCPMQQHPAYGQACAQLGATPLWARIHRGGECLAFAQLLSQRVGGICGGALMGRGPFLTHVMSPAEQAEIRQALWQSLPVTGLKFMIDGAEHPHDTPGFLQIMSPQSRAILPICPDAQSQEQRMHPKYRAALKKGLAGPLKLTQERFCDKQHRWLLAAEQMQRQERRYRNLPTGFPTAWAKAAPGSAHVFAAYLRGLPIAGILVLRHGASASYLLGWSGPLGRLHHAHAVLIWQATTWLRNAAGQSLDLGAIDTESTAATGLSRFKLRGGAEAVQLGGTYLRGPATRLFWKLAARQSQTEPSHTNRGQTNRAEGLGLAVNR
ncbi:MAG: GNAT family N-acetyltransferase [Mangrovicoccus sp.]